MMGFLLVKTDKISKKNIKLLKKECFREGCPDRGDEELRFF